MNLKNNLITLLLLTAIALAFAFGIFSFKFKDSAERLVTYDCSAEYNETLSDLTISSSIFLSMSPENHAYFDITGDLYHKDKHYKIARKYTFNYEKTGEKNYLLTNIALSKRASDNANDIQMEHLFFSPNATAEKTIQVTKIMNAYVVSNFYSPLFICASN